ncbi:helix-turn-helix transcriptional regulator [Mesorhizobium sp. M0152]
MGGKPALDGNAADKLAGRASRSTPTRSSLARHLSPDRRGRGKAADVTMDILLGSSRLKALRNWRQLTQAELAAAIDVSQGFLSDLESNRRKPSAQTSAMLAKALDVPGEWIEF